MKINNETIKKYLGYVSDTEPPLLHHIWALVGTMSANLGRRCYFNLGCLTIYPNQYVLLVGDPGVRKSTAMGYAKKFIKNNTRIRIAPDDTGGQRQGLISAMLGEGAGDDMIDSLLGEDIEGLDVDELSVAVRPHSDDRHCMFVYASEFASFLGQSSYELIVFLTKTWDGEDHNYTLKNSKCVLEKPLINLLGGTTPVAISSALPMEVVGQGFLSRVILVHADSCKKVARPKPLDENVYNEIRKIFDYVSENFQGQFSETKDASQLLDSLYDEEIDITDTRFVYYKTRRHTHLIKLAMAIAALRGAQTIIKEDVEDAHTILSLTERTMPNALGEFGLSPLGYARQKLLDFINKSPEPFTGEQLWYIMQRDMKPIDFAQTLKDFVNDNKVVTWSSDDRVYYSRNDAKQNKNKLKLEDLV